MWHLTVPSCAKKRKAFLFSPSPGGREHSAQIFGSLGFTSPLPLTFLVALAKSFCLLHKNYTMHGMDEGRLQKVIPSFAQGMLPHQGEAKIIARH